MKKFFAAVLLAAAVPEAGAASFNCGYATLPAEVAVCQDPTLSTFDEDMAQLYFGLLNSAPRWAVRRIRAEQRRFVAKRDGCGYDGHCLIGAYRRRIMELYDWRDRLGL